MRRAVRLASALALPLALFCAGGVAQRWIGDDGLINVRVAANLLAGDGFVYNVGERVEAVTSPLWVFLVAGLGALGAPLAPAAVWMGLVASLLGLALGSYGWSIATEQEPGRRFAPLGALVYAAVPVAWDYATSGLENGIGLLYLGGGFALAARAVRAEGRGAAALGLAVAGLGPLVRPEYALFALAFAAPVLLARGWTLRTRATLACTFAVSALAYQIFRMGYFGALVPNTALAKEAFEPRWEQGLSYLANTGFLYVLALPLGVCCVATVMTVGARWRAGARGEALLLSGIVLAALGQLTYVVRVGGDFMHGRMLLPGLFALLLPSFGVWLPKERRRAAAPVLALVLVGAWAAYCVSSIRVSPENEHGIGDERGWHARMAGVDHPTRVEDYPRFFFHAQAVDLRARVEAHCPELWPGPACRRTLLTDVADGRLVGGPVFDLDPAAVPSGVVGVAARRPLGVAGMIVGPRIRLVDPYGLADPIAARLELSARGRPGHEKHMSSAWLAGRYARPDAIADEGAKAARRALSCAPLAGLLDATSAPLDAARFFENLLRAPELHALRIPPDPREAERRFCAR